MSGIKILNKMTKEFIPYNLALALKELGFDEPCIAFYEPNNEKVMIVGVPQKYNNPSLLYVTDFCAPLYQQVFRWFREKYSLIGEIFSQLRPSNNFMYGFKIGGSDIIFDGFQTYEEAELACLKKLIEIVKEKL